MKDKVVEILGKDRWTTIIKDLEAVATKLKA